MSNHLPSRRLPRWRSLLLLMLATGSLAWPPYPSAFADPLPRQANPPVPPALPAAPLTVSAPVAAYDFAGDLGSLALNQPASAVPASLPPELETPLAAATAGDPAIFTSEPSIQRTQSPQAMPLPALVFDGLANNDNATIFGSGVNPPDPSGDVGPNHYIQAVNLLFRIFSKNGAPLTPPTRISSLFAAAPTGTACDSQNDGEPNVAYDPQADRWLISQFAVPGPDYYQCIAISKTPDPVAGGWWLYAVRTPFRLRLDDPKLTVWPDGYYLSATMASEAGGAPFGAVWALERSAMLAGRPLRQISRQLDAAFPQVLPANLRGLTPPPGSPAYLLSFQAPNKLALWRFAVNWTDPALSSFSGPRMLGVEPFAPGCPDTRDCVPFAGATPGLNELDGRSPSLMQHLQYRRIGSTESLWVTHSISATGRLAVRWYELRDPGGAATVHQQGTFAPNDGVWRWLGSMAADKDGNAAVGYSASSPVMKPAIRYAGRLAADPLNLLAQGEQTLRQGDGNPLTANSGWGDYSLMTVDPSDDCTFWYQNEFYKAADMPQGDNRWSTAIGSFKFPACAPLPPPGTIRGRVIDAVSGQPLSRIPLSAAKLDQTRLYVGSTDASGAFTLTVQPGAYALSAGPLVPGYLAAGTTESIQVASSGVANATIALGPTPNLSQGAVVINDAAGGNANGALEPGEAVQLQIELANSGLASATGIIARLESLTPGVTVDSAPVSYPSIAAGGSGGNLTPYAVSVAALPCGQPLDLRLLVTADQRSFTLNLRLPTGSPGAIRQYVSPELPQPIPGSNPATGGADLALGATARLTVTERFMIAEATVTLTISHTNDADVEVHLTSPLGQAHELSSDNGGVGDNYVNTTFDDAASQSIRQASAPFSGTYRPEGQLGDLKLTQAQGSWELHAYDDAVNGQTGSIRRFRLSLRAYECAFAVPNLAVAGASAAEQSGPNNGNGSLEPGEGSLALTVSVVNSGIPNLAAATDVIGSVTARTPGVSITANGRSFGTIQPNMAALNLSPFSFALDRSVPCGIPLEFTIQLTSAEGRFAGEFSLPSGAAPQPTSIFSDDLEQGTNHWINNANPAGQRWTATTESAHSPGHAWTDSPGGEYADNLALALESPNFNLLAFDTVAVNFWQRYDLEEDFDFGFVEYSLDNGATWQRSSAQFSGTQPAWTQASVELPELAHQRYARIRFLLSSDGSTGGDGWYLDDISLSGGARSCVPAYSQLYLPLIGAERR